MRFISRFLTGRRGGLENFTMVPRLTQVMIIALGIAADFFSRPATAQEPILAGYRDFNYGSTVISTPTAEKPESKLWWNDGYWWGSLWDSATNKYRIHRFDVDSQSWINVGPDIDDRQNSLGDALWDGQKLYVASHIYAGGYQQNDNTTPANSAQLYRYSYNPAAHTYSLDAGFPVLVNSAESETLVLDKDSTGQLWVTWTQAEKVYINRSLGDDLTWGTPFVLPVQGSELEADDIPTIIAFGGNKIGVMWSNQVDAKVYFAVHFDGNADMNWEPRETALADANLGAVADDHLNVKVMSVDGNLYAVTKTSLSSSSAPRTYALKRTPDGVWSKYVISNGAESQTRPVVMLDEENHELYYFASGDGIIRMKKVSLSNIDFPAGDGEAFIRSAVDTNIDDPASAKHNVNSTTGLLVIASTQDSYYYFHNYITLPAGGAPAITSFTPASGPIGTVVTITGNNFNGSTSVAFNGTAATSFTIDSNTQITATVPAGATTGKISVAKSAGTAFSLNTFTVRGSGQVVYEETKTGWSRNSATVTTWKGLAGVSGHLYLAAISTKDNAAVIGVSGLGLSWTLVKAQCAGRDNIGVEVWMAQATPGGGKPSGIGAVTAKLATRSRNAVIAVSRYSGVDVVNPLGNILSGNTNGVNGACFGGKDDKSYSFNLATIPQGGTMVYGVAAMRDRSHIPGAGYIERVEIKNGSASVAVQDKSFAEAGAAILNGTFSGNTDWAVVGLEMTPQLKASITAIGDPITANSPQVKSYQLEQNYPNPFNPGTSIRYSLPQAGEVRVTIYNIYGQTVSIPVNGFQSAGNYTFDWQAVDARGHALPSGVYFYRLEAGSNVVTRRMTLLR